MNIILWIVFGALAGWLASVLMKTDARQGTVGDIILGVVGSVIGGFVFGTLGQTGVTGFNVYSLIVAVVGSVILIAGGRMLMR